MSCWWVQPGNRCSPRRCLASLGIPLTLPGQTEPWQLHRGPCGWVLGVLHPWAGDAVSAHISPFTASHPGGRAGLPGEDGDAAVSTRAPAVPGACPAAGASPGVSLSLDHADSTASRCFPRGSCQPLCKLLTGKESDTNGSSPSKQLLPSLS